jgi:hypothetical protein
LIDTWHSFLLASQFTGMTLPAAIAGNQSNHRRRLQTKNKETGRRRWLTERIITAAVQSRLKSLAGSPRTQALLPPLTYRCNTHNNTTRHLYPLIYFFFTPWLSQYSRFGSFRENPIVSEMLFWDNMLME